MEFKTVICLDTKEIANTYEEYLKTRHWRLLRLKVAKKRHFRCEFCGEKFENHYEIHHKHYNSLGKEKIDDLMFLCKNCHNDLHIALKANKNTENKKSCFNCFYSQLMDFKGKKIKTVLWCNKKSFQCNNNICCYYKKGAEKIIPERVQLKKQRPRKKKRGRNFTKTYKLNNF